MSFNSQFLEKFNLDDFLHINFTDEKQEVMMPQNLVQVAGDCLYKCLSSQGLPHEEELLFQKFLQLVQAYRSFFCGGQEIKPPQESEIDMIAYDLQY